MRTLRALVCLMVAAASARAQWVDKAPHRVSFVTVQPDVRLHVLDFGGTGPAVVMLAGLGNTAHAFDEFAPALTDQFHVYAITRRGFGESSHPESGYETPRLVEDIRAVLDSLHLARVSLVGHSIAGEEMTRFAATYPERVEKLVFLDAAYDRVRAQALIDSDSVAAPLGEKVIAPARGDTLTVGAYVRYVHRSRGANIPEADIRARWAADGWREEATHAYTAIDVERPDYAHVRAPALAIYAVNDKSDELDAMLRAEFRSEVANARVIEIHGAHHWIFVSHRAQVLNAIRAFLKPGA